MLMVNPDISTSTADRLIWLTSLLVIPIPITIVGSWMVWNLRQQNRQEAQEQQKEENQHLQQVFFDLLQETGGEVTVLQFSMAAQISGKLAKEYLEQCAKEYNATFQVDEEGNISYRFPL
jgi:hypothetical protein